LVPLGFSHGFSRLIVRRYAGIINEDVETSKGSGGGVNQTLDVCALAHVRPHRKASASSRGDRVGDPLNRFGIPAVHYHCGACPGEALGNGAADATAAACHHCNLSIERKLWKSVHGSEFRSNLPRPTGHSS